MINWKVRIKNRLFWVAFIPAIVLTIQALASLFGIQLDLTDVQEKALDLVNAVFVLLAVMGVVADPTTEGLEDSALAKTYVEPKKKGY